jgi:hypothetical protein
MLHAALLLESTQYICLLFCANAMLDSMNDSMCSKHGSSRGPPYEFLCAWPWDTFFLLEKSHMLSLLIVRLGLDRCEGQVTLTVMKRG